MLVCFATFLGVFFGEWVGWVAFDEIMISLGVFWLLSFFLWPWLAFFLLSLCFFAFHGGGWHSGVCYGVLHGGKGG